MSRWVKVVSVLAVGLSALLISLVGAAYWSISTPGGGAPLVLPAEAVALRTEEGQRLLRDALAADHPALRESFQEQEKGSWCGVASAVAVLNARGASLTQEGLFTPEATEVRSQLRVTFLGMALAELAGLLQAHGATATATHAGEADVDAFRAALTKNAAQPGDWLIVNYDRQRVGEVGSGHLSPVAAFSPQADLVLVMDTARYKYPPHWVPVKALFEAMNTTDPSTGVTRGWVEVR